MRARETVKRCRQRESQAVRGFKAGEIKGEVSAKGGGEMETEREGERLREKEVKNQLSHSVLCDSADRAGQCQDRVKVDWSLGGGACRSNKPGGR